jgi:Carboxypeptidase regulatory-like domain
LKLTALLSVLIVIALALALRFAPSALAAGEGKITGTVTTNALMETPIKGIEVCAREEGEALAEPGGEGLEGGLGGNFVEQCATTEASGEYTISDLPAGKYEVEFAVPFKSELNYIPQYYKGRSSPLEGELVSVTAGETTRGIDAKLDVGGWITGKVTDASTTEAVEGIEVCAFSTSSASGRCAITNSEGRYTVATLPGGKYEVAFSSPLGSSLNYVFQYYEDKSSFSEAGEVPVTVEAETPGIDAELAVGGQIAGRVTDASTGAALADIFVCARPVSSGGEAGGCAVTGENGEYTISGLPSGSYKVGFNGGPNYITQYYNDEYTVAEGQAVSVVVKSVVAGIDAALEPGPAVAPANTGLPVVSGTPTVGDTLSCSSGSWTGHPAPTFTYEWLRDGIPIPGATTSSYVAQSADEGRSVACEVFAKNAAGKKRATSASVVVSPLPPIPTALDLLRAAPRVTVTTSKAVLSGRAASVHIECDDETPCKGSIELTVEVVTKRRKGKQGASHATVVLAKGSFSLGGDKSGTVVLRLTAAGRRRLAHAKRHPVAAKLTVSLSDGKRTTKSVLVA